MLRPPALAAAAAAALIGCGGAFALTPSQTAVALAKDLTPYLRSYYDKGSAGVRITNVTCTVAANERSGRCRAYFTNPLKTIRGVFVLRETIDQTTGLVHTKTVSARCKLVLTGAPVIC